jgi:predicted DNA-binding transcriptional regulator AlpA
LGKWDAIGKGGSLSEKMDPHRLIKAVELKELLGGISEPTLQKWCDLLGFPIPLRIGHDRFWLRAAVNRWIAQRPWPGKDEK